MEKYSITDRRWLGDAIGGFVFLAVIGVVLYVWLTSMHPLPESLLSTMVYYGVLCALVGAILAICIRGFTYRRSDFDAKGLVVHEGYYGLVWKRRAVPKSQIATVERYDEAQRGMFGRWVSGIRVNLVDGSAIVLAQTHGKGKYGQEVADVRRALGFAPENT